MITRNDKIKCDECGKFIAYKDLAEGKATNIMVTPESPVSYETYESKCKRCRTASIFMNDDAPNNIAIDDYPL